MKDYKKNYQFDDYNKKMPSKDSDSQRGKQKKIIKIKRNIKPEKIHQLNLKKYSSTILPEIVSASILQKHSVTESEYALHIIENLIELKNSHLLAVFNDQIITDYIDEFFKRPYKMKESLERIPKFANYYKNYLQFFCKPTFADLELNTLIQFYGEAKAEIYYIEHYGNHQSNKKKSPKNENIKSIFSNTVKNEIDNNSSLGESIINCNNDSSILMTENYISSKTDIFKKSFYEESLLSILDIFQQKPQIIKEVKEVKVSSETQRNKINYPQSYLSVTERVQKSKDNNKDKDKDKDKDKAKDKVKSKDKEKSTYEVRRTSPNQKRKINQNTTLRINKKTNIIKSKPIKLTNFSNFKSLHIKTPTSYIQPYSNKDLITKASNNTQSQAKLSVDSSIPNKPSNSLRKSKLSLIKPNTSTNTNTVHSPSGNINVNDVIKLTFRLYSPTTKGRNNKTSTIQHHHTVSSPTINNFNININNHISVNEGKSGIQTNQNNSNTISSTHRKQQTIREETKKNIHLHFELKNIISKNKNSSRNKPQSLSKAKTGNIKLIQKNTQKPNTKNNTHKLFSSFTIFELQQQLLNSKTIPSAGNKKSIGSKKSEELLSSIQFQSPNKTMTNRIAMVSRAQKAKSQNSIKDPNEKKSNSKSHKSNFKISKIVKNNNKK